MDRIENFKALGVSDYGTARDGLLRSMVALSLGFVEAYGFTDTPDKAAFEAFKRDAKAGLRERGEDRKTADRHVNRAATVSAQVASKFAAQVNNRDAFTPAQLTQAIFLSAKAEGAKNIAAFVRLVKGEGAADPDAVPETDAAKVASEAENAALATIKTETDARERLAVALSQIETMGFDSELPEAEAEAEVASDIMPIALDMSKLSDYQLACLMDDIRAEQVRRTAATLESDDAADAA